MPWCPKCKTEYREGFKQCSDCNSELVNALEAAHPDESSVIGNEQEDYEVFLMSSSDEFEAGMLESLLNSQGIPVLTKHRGAGAYIGIYMGTSQFGVDLYVPSRLLEKAKNVLLAAKSTNEDLTESTNEDIRNEDLVPMQIDKLHNWIREIKRWWFLFLIILFLISTAYSLSQSMPHLR